MAARPSIAGRVPLHSLVTPPLACSGPTIRAVPGSAALSSGSPEEITRLLHRWSEGDPAALDQLTPIIHHELRRLAGGYMRRERHGHTLQPTALVNEAYLRLMRDAEREWADRVHFFAIAARHMRQILIQHARRRRRHKRGGGAVALTLEEGLVATHRPDDLVALDDALVSLAGFDERMARIVEMHFFGGLTHEEIGAVLGLHYKTVARDLRLARAWLQNRLRGGQ